MVVKKMIGLMTLLSYLMTACHQQRVIDLEIDSEDTPELDLEHPENAPEVDLDRSQII